MFKFRSNSVLRFKLLAVFLFTLIGLFIIVKAAIIMFIEREDWNKIKEKNIKYNEPIKAHRGNILGDNGELIVSTLPQYRMRFDLVYIDRHNKEKERKVNAQRDSIWERHLKDLCVGLNDILPGTSVAELEKRFMDGLYPKKGKRRGGYEPYRGKISYSQYKKILELPIINAGKALSGFYTVEDIERKNIFGDTGNSTFGIVREVEIDGKKVDEVNGLEKKYNKYLKGKAGSGTRIKTRGKYILREDVLPENGYDLQTTLNTKMLDICHNAIERVLIKKQLAAGWAILMETKTGDIKAIVNLSRHVNRNGKVVYIDTIGSIKYNQTANHALCDLNEPGSIFKTVALTAALADGKLTTKDSVIAYKSMQCKFSGANKPIKDEMFRDNGTGKYSMSDAMMYSSNISLIQFIRKAYGSCPEEYTNTLQRFGLTQNYNLTDNEATPYITLPGTKKWNGFSLSSMSYGYAVSMTAINMVSFYNTIANGGRQMHPRLVKAVLDNGEIVEEFPTKVINRQLFPKAVADTVTSFLVNVVNGYSIDKVNPWRAGKRDGTGLAARSEMMTIAGKTGTAIADDGNRKLMSFCGFFPAEAPEYTLIVQMLYDKNIPRPADDDGRYGGGSTSALAFKEIAEKVMAEKLANPIENAAENGKAIYPKIKKGNLNEADYLLSAIGLPNELPAAKEGLQWGDVVYDRAGGMKSNKMECDSRMVPDVRGMGAKDATYLLQQCGLNVVLEGYGTVRHQSITPGRTAPQGATAILQLKP